MYDLYVNPAGNDANRGVYAGATTSSRLLAPEWTDYRKRVQLQRHDVAALLRPGRNVFEVTLPDGGERLLTEGRHRIVL